VEAKDAADAAVSKAEKIKILDAKLKQAMSGDEVDFTVEETRKLYGRMHTAVNKDAPAATKAREAIEEIEDMKKGKDAAKKGVLRAWIKDPQFGTAFWQQLDSLTTLNCRKKKAQWLSKAQVVTKYGDEADEIMKSLPSRKHPKAPKVKQWMDVDDIATLEVQKAKVMQHKGESKLDGNQTKGLLDAMDGLEMDDDALDETFDGFKSSEQDPAKISVNNLPAHIKRMLKAAETPVDGEPAEKGTKKAAWEDKVSVAAGDDDDVAHTKVKKMASMVVTLKLKIQQELHKSKKARYQPDPKLMKESTNVLGSFTKLAGVLEAMLVQGCAGQISKIKKQLEIAAVEYKEGQRILTSLQGLNKN
jgi:hypothetical protein